MDPEKLDEMIEIFDWIEVNYTTYSRDSVGLKCVVCNNQSQLPPDDPQQIQKILNNVNNYITGSNDTLVNYTDIELLSDLTRLPDFLYQVDNGVDFMKMNGVPILLRTYKQYNSFNHSTTANSTLIYQILSQIMDTIGVATQNNPNAIQYAHQSNLVSFIIDELNEIYTKHKENGTPINGQLINKLLFTLSSITRQNDIGLQHLQRKNGQKVLYKCGKLLSHRIDTNETLDDDDDDNINNLKRAFKKLLTMISDIVVLNGNKLEYSGMFLKDRRWCGLMVDKGLLFHPESVLQFIDFGLQRNYCVDGEMLTSLKSKLNKIKDENTPKSDEIEEDEYYDESLLTQSTNMLQHIDTNFKTKQKTEL